MALLQAAARSFARQVAPSARSAGRRQFSTPASAKGTMASAGEKIGWFFNPTVRVPRFVDCALLIDAPFAPHAPDLASSGCLSCTRWCAAVVMRACSAIASRGSERAPGSGPRMRRSGPPGLRRLGHARHRI